MLEKIEIVQMFCQKYFRIISDMLGTTDKLSEIVVIFLSDWTVSMLDLHVRFCLQMIPS
jgi:hypothetical protein